MRVTDKNRFPKLDTKATASKVDALLRAYPDYLAIAHRSFIRSPQLSGMPAGTFDPAAVEHVVINGMDATQFVLDAKRALWLVREYDGDDWYNVLDLTYFTRLRPLNVIYDRLNISNTAYYNIKRWALCSFAELFPTTWGELLVYEVKQA